jgi:hypothetical protein
LKANFHLVARNERGDWFVERRPSALFDSCQTPGRRLRSVQTASSRDTCRRRCPSSRWTWPQATSGGTPRHWRYSATRPRSAPPCRSARGRDRSCCRRARSLASRARRRMRCASGRAGPHNGESVKREALNRSFYRPRCAASVRIGSCRSVNGIWSGSSGSGHRPGRDEL